MTVEIVIPRLGLTMDEGTIVVWLKKEGDQVKAGEPLFEVETDKAVVQIEAPATGILEKIIARAGETHPVGTVIGSMGEAGEKPATIKASPAARRLAHDKGIDLTLVNGSGPGGRVVASDINKFIPLKTAAKEHQHVKISPVARKITEELKIDVNTIKGSGPSGRITRQDVEHQIKKSDENIIPLSRMHLRMAERMITSFNSAPHFYLHREVDARQLVSLRQVLLPKMETITGVRLTYTDLFIKFCALSLEKHPKILTQWTDGGYRQLKEIHIGVAMDTPNGLIVPVIHYVERMTLQEISKQRFELSTKAESSKLLPQDLELGVFTITNLGMFGVDSFDAILYPPQAAILAVGRIKESPMVSQGQVQVGVMLNLSLSIDHRLVDGASGARFLGDLADLIENPGLVLV